MFNKVMIRDGERGLLFRRGSYNKLLGQGVHRLMPFAEEKVAVLDIAKPFVVEDMDLRLFLQDAELLEALEVVQVADHELVLHYENGTFAGVLRAGTHAFWRLLNKHRFDRVDIREPKVPEHVDRAVLPKLVSWLQVFHVASHETGILYYNHVMQAELAPGSYYFWKGPTSVAVKTIDLRRQQLDMIGQEIMTEDKVALRLNFVSQYRITDPLRSLETKSLDDQLYIQLQLVLREYVGTLKLDDLLRMKQEVAGFVLARMQEQGKQYGVEFLSAGVKDIVLPGEVRDILNTVLLAEKKAQATIITRREETASTRSLLNTAKLMDDNQTLYRLKELEFLEKICEKIGHISLSGGGNLLEQLNSLLAAGTADRQKG
ncbi:slipin family protein [Paenibacillus sambharensis]|uniref:Slipin family protein n=1 Tax=Paenibacillus sambharensis TaxID=1803190 RepID=A0A2W1L458_9BACL|nr:slipin family protein [Paenibacillus sambharensis]PZD92960.1 slipin family protein [Paenibacillus sambharensis]